MTTKNEFEENPQAIQAHLQIAQSVIQRMASNSSSCKAWCITLVSAILVIVAGKTDSQYALIAVIPTILFLVLDTYYLALENGFRQSYNIFIDKLHKDDIVASDLYAISATGRLCKNFFKSFCSFSIWPFYLMLLAMIWIAVAIVI